MQRNDGGGIAADFLLLVTNHQSALYAAVVAMLGSANGAQDILQETNAALLRKAGEYDPSKPFVPWAVGFARMQVQAWRKRQRRDRLVLDEDVFTAVADQLVRDLPPSNPRLEALEECLARLQPASRELIEARYTRDEPVQSIAQRLGQSANVVSVTLFRVRQALLDCIQARLAAQGE